VARYLYAVADGKPQSERPKRRPACASPTPSSIFQNAAWLQGTNAANGGTELYKLGADGSVTFWKDIIPGPNGSFPTDWARLG